MKFQDFNVSTTFTTNLGTKFGPRTYRCEGIGVDTLVAPAFGSLDPSTSTADNAALQVLYKRIRKSHQEFSGLTFLGEIRQSLKMIRKPALSLREGLEDYLKALKKRSRGIPMSTAGRRTRKRILADTWLEFSFGWTPLVSDLKSAVIAVARLDAEKDGLIHRRSRVSARGSAQAANLYSLGVYGLGSEPTFMPIWLTRKDFATKEVIYRAYMDYTTAVPTGSAERLLELSGFSFKEFIPTAWELIPWSFLVDYFSNVGDILEAFTTPLSNVYAINKTIRTTNNVYVRTRLRQDALKGFITFLGSEEDGNGCGGYDSKQTVVGRVAVSPLNLALPTFKLENPFGTNAIRRSLNMLSLAAGARPLKPFY
jgi:hypothetical protein